MDIKVTFPDQNQRVYSAGITASEVIGGWQKNALNSAVAAKVNGNIVDLTFPLAENTAIEPVDVSSKEGLSILRHSISHVMAHAVQDVFKGAKVTIGPSIEDGFYYDFEYSETFFSKKFVLPSREINSMKSNGFVELYILDSPSCSIRRSATN